MALYIHIPWCVRKCPYCDFNSHELGPHDQDNAAMYQHYVDALIADIHTQLSWVAGRKLQSVFIGGGTPSLLPVAQYRRLFAALKQVLDFACDIEITLEANPGTLEHAPFSHYLDLGINRLSLGVQSFAQDKLTRLGRIHNPAQARQAIIQARAAGFTRVNVDLMHGLPEQTAAQALSDLAQAHDAGATHLSWYQLTIEPNTVFYRNTPVLPDETALLQIEAHGKAWLQAHGYHNYEVSAWVGAHDRACQHNLIYWQFGDYLAIGAGAHGKLTGTDTQGNLQVHRFSKSRLPKDYVSTCPPKMVNWGAVASDELRSDYMLNALRLTQGVPLAQFAERTGLDMATIQPTLAKLTQQGLLRPPHAASPARLQTTDLGQRYLNQVIAAFL